jgi:hypothetical protein
MIVKIRNNSKQYKEVLNKVCNKYTYDVTSSMYNEEENVRINEIDLNSKRAELRYNEEEESYTFFGQVGVFYIIK